MKFAKGEDPLDFLQIMGWILETIKANFLYTKSLVNTNLFNTNFTSTHFQKVPIPHFTRTMKQKFLH